MNIVCKPSGNALDEHPSGSDQPGPIQNTPDAGAQENATTSVGGIRADACPSSRHCMLQEPVKLTGKVYKWVYLIQSSLLNCRV